MSNYSHYDLPVQGLTVQLTSQSGCRASGSVAYKGKVTPLAVKIAGVRDVAGGSRRVRLSLVVPHGRTVRVRVECTGK